MRTERRGGSKDSLWFWSLFFIALAGTVVLISIALEEPWWLAVLTLVILGVIYALVPVPDRSPSKHSNITKKSAKGCHQLLVALLLALAGLAVLFWIPQPDYYALAFFWAAALVLTGATYKYVSSRYIDGVRSKDLVLGVSLQVFICALWIFVTVSYWLPFAVPAFVALFGAGSMLYLARLSKRG